MANSLRLMCVLAHPDDESLGTGGILARYAAEGVHTTLLTATGGEQGWSGAEGAYPGPDVVREVRARELRCAAQALGVEEVVQLDYRDGELDRAGATAVTAEIAHHLRRLRPQVVVTFDPYGVYGHPDHVAICQLTTAATVAALQDGQEPGHRVAKLYYMVATEAHIARYQAVFGDLVMRVDEHERGATPWPAWAVTTRVDARPYWRTVRDAVFCHRSQLDGNKLHALDEEQHAALWGTQLFYRAFSLVNGGREREDDLFAGLRPAAPS